jgi:hypothetical protein
MAGRVLPVLNQVIQIDPPKGEKPYKAIVQIQLNGGTITVRPRAIAAETATLTISDGQLIQYVSPGGGAAATADITAAGIYEFSIDGKSLLLQITALTGAPAIVYNLVLDESGGAAGGSSGGGDASAANQALQLTALNSIDGKTLGNIIHVSDAHARVNDANAYVSGDVWATTVLPGTLTFHKFAAAVRVASGWAYLTKLRASINRAVNLPAIRIHFWRAIPSIKTGDNLAFALASADNALHQGYWDLPAATVPAGAGTDSCDSFDGTPRFLLQGDATQDIYYSIELRGAFAPLGTDILTLFASFDQAA